MTRPIGTASPSPSHRNRLASEASPYLLQHASNPVDWYPWGPEALAKAKTEDKPILLSIGYSACHWCHVMERESFENDAIARQMNEHFVCIKVDREERPDLDHIYQLVVQLMGRSGGWPLTVFLTPNQEPFFGGTYFPPADRYGMPGFPRVLEAIADAYRSRRAEVDEQARELADAIGRAARVEIEHATPEGSLGPGLLESAARELSARFDDRNGGFGTRPKFPNTMCLELLLRHAVLQSDAESVRRVRLALDRMRSGGIWDHLGGGFHRYSTDERWLVPHFEKMLYDNALLLELYANAYRAFGHEPYADTARAIAGYLTREMQSPGGGFFATQDADSEGEEGKFFVWTEKEVDEALSGDDLAREVAKLTFGVEAGGNFESSGATVLSEVLGLAEVANRIGRPESEVRSALDRARAAMFAARERRPRPFRDEKILASWNGLVIGALAEAGLALGDSQLIETAARAFDHVERALVDGGRVARFVKGGFVRKEGFLDDHAFVCRAAIVLYEATGGAGKLRRARAIADEMIGRFFSEEESSFLYTPSDGEPILARTADPFDQAIPSGNSVASLALLALGTLADERYTEYARRQLERLAPAAARNPFAFGQTVAALDRLVRGSTDVLVVGRREDDAARALHAAAGRAYLPNRTLAVADPNDEASRAAAAQLLAGKPAGAPGAAAYVCRGRTCSAPITDAHELAATLASDPGR